jgi:CubicO group peptidase (beta-lactamase class C family)
VSGAAASGSMGRLLSARVGEGWMPGAAWWIEGPRGPIDHGAVGRAAVEPEKVLLGQATPFDLASLTKPLCTALLLALLEGEDRLDVRRPVSDWLPGLGGSAFAGVSLLDLATHRGRLPAWRPLYLHGAGREAYLEQIAREAPAVPDGRVLYSDLGYLLLGWAIEKATGEGLDGLFRERVVKPLGGPRIGFAEGGFGDAAATERGNGYERSMAGDEGRAHAWRTRVLRGEVHDANAWGLGGVAGHAGLFGTVEAVATVAREILRPEILAIGASARERMLVARDGAEGRTAGMVVASASGAARGILPDTAPGHTGFTGTSLWLDPSTGRFFILLTNRVHPTVGPRDFQRVRRAFHRLALRLSGGGVRALPLQ